MKNLWSQSEAKKYSKNDLSIRVYTSRLLGRNPELVLHGGGNTSVKGYYKNIFGEEKETLFIKGSGWDLISIEEDGFAPVDLDLLDHRCEFRATMHTPPPDSVPVLCSVAFNSGRV